MITIYPDFFFFFFGLCFWFVVLFTILYVFYALPCSCLRLHLNSKRLPALSIALYKQLHRSTVAGFFFFFSVDVLHRIISIVHVPL